MRYKFICLLLALLAAVSAFSSCDSERNALTLSPAEISTDEGDNIVFSFEKINVSEGLYSYVFKEAKDYYFSKLEAVVINYGVPLSADGDVPLEDNKDFWTAVVPNDVYNYLLEVRSELDYDFRLTVENVGECTYADLLKDHVDASFRTYLACVALADEYGFVPAEDYESYETGLNAKITLELTDADFLKDTESIADSKGELYDWVVDRWEVYLAGQGITRSEWISFNYDFPVIMGNLSSVISESEGGDENESKDSAEIEELFAVCLEKIEAERVDIRYIFFDLLSEKNYDLIKYADDESSKEEISEMNEFSDDAVESEEVSVDTEELSEEENVEDASNEASSESDAIEAFDTEEAVLDSENYDDYVKATIGYCEAAYDLVVAGEMKFDKLYELSPYGAYILSEGNGEAYLSNNGFTEQFGKDYKDVIAGTYDMIVDEEQQVIWMLEYVDWTPEDFSFEEKEQIVNTFERNEAIEDMNRLLDGVIETIDVDEAVTADFDEPWAVD